MNFNISLKPNRIRLLRKVLSEIQKSNTKKHIMFLVSTTQFGIFTSHKERTLMKDNIDIKCIFNLNQISYEEENEIACDIGKSIRFSMYRDTYNEFIEQTANLENFTKIYTTIDGDDNGYFLYIHMSNESSSNMTVMNFPIQLDPWDMDLLTDVKVC